MKVLKFGGTSVGTVDSLINVKAIVESLEEPAVVIVSALGGLTDKLIKTAQISSAGCDDYITELESIRKRHFDIIDALVRPELIPNIKSRIDLLLNELESRFQGVSLIQFLPESTLAEIVSFGERMSSIIVAAIIKDAVHFNSLEYIKTEKWFNKNIADRSLTNRLILKNFKLPLRNTVIAGGFISTDKNTGEITNLGRGGSDYTAALIAAALNAECLEIWTDVDGFLTADPRIIPSARLIPEMSFVESMELCSFGAKVIYPPTIYPVFHKNIPIKILNTFNLSAQGTLICDKIQNNGKVRGVSSLGKTSLIRIKGHLTDNVAEINSRAYNVIARNGIGIYLVSPPTKTDSFSLALSSDSVEEALEALKIEFAPEIKSAEIECIEGISGLSVIAMVGEGIKSQCNLGGCIARILNQHGIDVLALSENASDTTVALVVEDGYVTEAMKIIHSICFNDKLLF